MVSKLSLSLSIFLLPLGISQLGDGHCEESRVSLPIGSNLNRLTRSSAYCSLGQGVSKGA